MSEYPLVEIKWLDSARPIDEWQLIEEADWSRCVRVRSVGWLVHNGEVKALAPNLGRYEDGEPDQVCGVIRIPRPAIISMRELATIVTNFTPRLDQEAQ